MTGGGTGLQTCYKNSVLLSSFIRSRPWQENSGELSFGRSLQDEAEVFLHLRYFFEFCHVDVSAH